MAGKGNTSRSNDYKKDLYARVKSDHPIKMGIEMQAHHLISISGMAKSGMRTKISSATYDINHPNNCVFLPSTLKGACYLKIQVHKSGHTAVVFGDDSDSAHNGAKMGVNYHRMVKKKLIKLKKLINDACEKKDGNEDVINGLNSLSWLILELIEDSPEEAPLTKFYGKFQEGGPGCGGGNTLGSMDPDNMKHCPHNRSHFNQKDINGETITYPLKNIHKFEPGQ